MVLDIEKERILQMILVMGMKVGVELGLFVVMKIGKEEDEIKNVGWWRSCWELEIVEIGGGFGLMGGGMVVIVKEKEKLKEEVVELKKDEMEKRWRGFGGD